MLRKFTFDLQRFATKTFRGGFVGDESGFTLNELFNAQGKSWLAPKDTSSFTGETNFFWDKSALVELTPASANAEETVAGAIQLVAGKYENKGILGNGEVGYIIKSVTSIDARNLKGTATFKTIGSTTIVNPKGTIAIGNNTVTFSGGGLSNAETDDNLDWDVGTKISVSSGAIKNVTAAAGEEVTTANGVSVDFTNGGTATFNGAAFGSVTAFAAGDSAVLDVDNGDKIVLEAEADLANVTDGATGITATFSGQAVTAIDFNSKTVAADVAFGGSEMVGTDIAIQKGTVNVSNIAGTSTSQVLYHYSADNSNILDLTNVDQITKNGKTLNVTANKTGNANFLIATDYAEDDEDGSINMTTVNIGGTEYTFNDIGSNGGVFMVSSNAVTGFVFRDVGDFITVPQGASLKFYNATPTSSSNELDTETNGDYDSLLNAEEIDIGLTVTSSGEYMVGKKEDGGYAVEVYDGTTVQIGDVTIVFSLETTRANRKSPASAVVNITEEGLLQSIASGTISGSSGTNTGLEAVGSSVTITGLTEDAIDPDSNFTVGGITVDVESGQFNYVVEGDKGATEGTKTIHLTASEDTINSAITAKVYPYEGTSGTVTYLDYTYSFNNASGEAYLYTNETGLEFVFVEKGDSITIPDGAEVDLRYVDKSNDNTVTAIPTSPVVTDSDTYTIAMTTATSRRSAAAEFTVSGLYEDSTLDFGDAQLIYEGAADGTFTFNQAGLATGFTANGGTVTLDNDAATTFLQQVDDEGNAYFKIDGTVVNINAVTDADNDDAQLVYNAADHSLYGLAAGSIIVDAGSITKIFAPSAEGAFTFGADDDALTFTAYGADGDAGDTSTRAYFTVANGTATGFTFVDYDDSLTGTDFSALTLTDAPTETSFAAPVFTADGEATEATILKAVADINGTETDCYSTFGTDLDDKTVTFSDGTKLTFNDAQAATEVLFDTNGKLLSILNLDKTGNQVAVEGATGTVYIDDSEIDIEGGGFIFTMLGNKTPAITDVMAGTRIIKAANVERISTAGGAAGVGIFKFGDVSYEVTGSKNTGVVFNLDKDLNVTSISGVDGDESVKIVYEDKVIFTNSDSAKTTLTAHIITADATARTKAIRIVGNTLDNSILGGKGKDTLYGKDGDDYLEGGKGNDKLYGQNGNDTLIGGAGNDTLTGGTGADVFIYSGGNDVITDFSATDTLQIGDGTDTYVRNTLDNNIIVTVGDDTITLTGAASLSTVNILGKEIVPSLTFTNANTAKHTLPAEFVLGDASTRTTAIRITGNALNNSIVGGKDKDDTLYGGAGADYLAGNAGNDKLYGQTGNDILEGGTGNDTLTGGTGADVFIYSAGKDVITDFADDDLLQITGTFSATYNASKNTIAFKVGSTASAITLKNFTASTFNINGDAYAISGTKLVKRN